jgi:preprotein translocase subunit SecG
MPGQIKWAIAFAAGAALILVGWRLPVLLTTLHVLLCFMLIVVVLLQSGKAADLAGAFGGAGSQTAFGPRGAATWLSRATTWCAVMFMLTSMALTLRQSTEGPTGTSVLERTQPQAPKAPAPFGAPVKPVEGQPGAPPPASGQQPPAKQQPPPKQP